MWAGLGRSFTITLVTTPQGSLGARHEVQKIQPRHVFPPFSSEPGDGAIRKHHLKPQKVRSGGAVLENLVSPGVFCHIAPDVAYITAAGISRIEESLLGGSPVDLCGYHAGFCRGGAIFRIDFKNPVHLLKGEHHPPMGGHRPSGESCSRSPGGDGNALCVGVTHGGRHLLGGLRKEHHFGAVVLVPEVTFHFVVGIGFSLIPLGGHILLAHEGDKLFQHFGGYRGIVCTLHSPRSFRIRSISRGSMVWRSPQRARSATLKIGASGSLLTPTIYPAVCIPARCCTLPEIPAPR